MTGGFKQAEKRPKAFFKDALQQALFAAIVVVEGGLGDFNMVANFLHARGFIAPLREKG